MTQLPQPLQVLAQNQFGLLTRAQMAQHLSRGAVEWRTGVLPRVGYGVYLAQAGADSRAVRTAAMLLAGGPTARLWRWSAAWAEGWTGPSEAVEILVPHDIRPLRSQVRQVHRGRMSMWRPGSPVGLPRTWPEDTALDCAQTLDGDELAHFLLRVIHSHGVRPPQLQRAMSRRSRIRARGLIATLAGEASAGSQSGLEYLALRDVFRAHGLPEPQRQFRLATGVVDLRLASLVVELDGALGHEGRARQHDVRKDNHNAVAGLSTLRYGYEDVTRRACACSRQVVAAASARGMRLPWRPCPRCRSAAQAA